MDNRAKPNSLGFAADRVELFLRERGLAALANAAGRKNLDDVRAVLRVFLNNSAQFVRCSCGLSPAENRVEGGENSWPWQTHTINGVSKILVECSAEALHRGEAGGEHLPTIRSAREDRLFLGFALPGKAAVGVEVLSGMNMRIDPAGHNRQPSEVVEGTTFRANSSDLGNFSTLNNDNR